MVQIKCRGSVFFFNCLWRYLFKRPIIVFINTWMMSGTIWNIFTKLKYSFFAIIQNRTSVKLIISSSSIKTLYKLRNLRNDTVYNTYTAITQYHCSNTTIQMIVRDGCWHFGKSAQSPNIVIYLLLLLLEKT